MQLGRGTLVQKAGDREGRCRGRLCNRAGVKGRQRVDKGGQLSAMGRSGLGWTGLLLPCCCAVQGGGETRVDQLGAKRAYGQLGRAVRENWRNRNFNGGGGAGVLFKCC